MDDRARVLQIAAVVQIVALLESVTVDLVKQRAQAHAEPLRRLAPISPRPPKSLHDRLTLRPLDHLSERTAPFSPLPGGEGRGERSFPEINRLEDLLVREHRRTLDRMLERPHVSRPRLLAQPGDGRVTQRHRATQSVSELSGEVAGERGDVLAPLDEGREVNGDDVQTIEQVMPKPAGGRLGREVPRSGRE